MCKSLNSTIYSTVASAVMSLLLGDLEMMIAAYLSKQCAALTSQRSLMMEAPQVWRPWNLRLTCHGSSPCRASSPPTTRLPIAGRVPQAAGGKSDDVVKMEMKQWWFFSQVQQEPHSYNISCQCSLW